ncbi:MAG: phosphoribosylformylglycinamidine synthase subunit PurQ, partial [Oscillospiraceae bacterium]|nr:phosphoribosylformylglycinamidine synthase subunit PurQ [Oscillospiraceae bacterium]
STNGALKYADVEVKEVNFENKNKFGSFDEIVSDLNVCSQRGLGDKFDSTVGAGTVVNLYGGKHQLTAPQYMAAKIPVLNGETKTASVMAFGFDPFLSTTSQYHGAIYAVVDSLAKIVASGASYKDCYLSFQEYFERNNNVPSRWGKPFAALLGAFKVQMELGVGSIGGKDSMSGSFENLDVPPMLCSFAVAATKADKMITPEFKKAGSNVYLLECKTDENNLPDFDNLRQLFDKVHKLASAGKLKAIYAVGYGGVAEAVVKMCFGNRIGFKFSYDKDLFISKYGSFVVETDCELDGILLGHTTEEYNFDTLEAEWKKPLESVFPTIIGTTENVERISYDKRDYKPSGLNIAKPRVLIPVFPGTNGEYDSQRAFDKAGALTDVLVFKNFNDLAKAIDNSQILMLSGGSESEFITTVLKNPIVNEAIQRFDGLILGIGVGFQALVKSGLLPGDLIFNTIGRHQSMMVNTRIASVKSPWFSNVSVGDIHTLPISTAEGRFISNNSVGKDQIAAQYVDFDGNPTMDIRYNPSGSMLAVEGIFNSDGRIFGKMAHNERISNHVAINIPGNKDQKIFEAGVKYFK